MKVLVIFLLFPISLFSQKVQFEKSDSLKVSELSYPTYFLKINNNSSSDPSKVFIGYVKDFDSLKKIITKCYFSRKQEYNEYYLLGVNDITDTQKVNRVLKAFLNQIDSNRVLRNRSTFLHNYTLINYPLKINYQDTFKDLSQVSNVFILRSLNDLRKNMRCPYSGKHTRSPE